MKTILTRAAIGVAIASISLASTMSAQVTTPSEAFGFNIGDDYHLATYSQLEAYWQTLAAESPRMVLEEIGKTEEGRSQWMAILTSPENHANLDRYREMSRRLARAEGLTDDEARALAAEGKAVVWIDGGLHATEVLGAHQLMEFVYQMVSRDDEETTRFLDDVIVLAVHANPDGMELVSNWYMREADTLKRSTRGIPRLYQKYTGHDNNRDFYMSTQSETTNMNRIMYRTWFPQIVYNHHQTGPAGTVMFAPPFRDPFNYNYDPLVPLGIEAVGTAMHMRFVAEGKPGTTMRSGASYSTWWNGGLRTTPYFHNMIGLLTETIGNPTPVRIPFLPDRQLPRNDLPFPIEPQVWHFRQSIDYSQTANRAVLDYASRNREGLLFNIYRMGRNAIDRGSRDTWTMHPKIVEAAKAAVRTDQSAAERQSQGGRFRGYSPEVFKRVLRDPDLRDPRAYILSSAQTDFPTATKFVNTLIKLGVIVHRATEAFDVNAKTYPEGSYVVLTAQAFGPHVFDMFEPQDHPNDFEYPGGPPISPYDNTGWTLSYQMAVEVDRILEAVEGPFEVIDGFAPVPAGQVASESGATGFLVSHEVNDAVVATNRIMEAGGEVYWLMEPRSVDDHTWPAGTIYVPASNTTRNLVSTLAAELGVNFHGISEAPGGNALKISPARIGVWDRYGGSMPSGWTQWILEQFEFPYEVVYAPQLDDGDLNDRFDVLVFVNGAIPPVRRGSGQQGSFGGQIDPEAIPAEYRNRLGRVSADQSIPQIESFVRNGGTVITIGSSTNLAEHMGLNLPNYLIDEAGKQLGRDKYFIPGSILRVRIDNSDPIAFGLEDEIDVHFNNSPVFSMSPASEAAGVRRIGWFDRATPLRSGWAWGQEALEGGTTIAAAEIGEGKLYLFGPEILRRAQPHGTFKFLFNGIHLSGSTPVELDRAATGSR